MPVVEAEGLYKVFGRGAERAVDQLRKGTSREELRAEGVTAAVIDATFDVDAGEVFVVMGLSGSGKSTLIRMINGLLEPTAGSLRIHGQDITALDKKSLRAVRQEKVSMVFQHFALFPHRTVGENAAYGLEVKGLNKADRQARASEALSLVGLEGWGDSLPGQLSGGMRQRVGLARALAAETDIMLMDEAFSALDPLIRREMQDQLVDLQRRLEKTILFITHDLNEAMRLGDRIAMMRDGVIVQIGSAEEILNHPSNDYVAQFIHDVDRSRVLTASSVMEQPTAVEVGQDLRIAHDLLSDGASEALFVVDKGVLKGVLYVADVAAAVAAGTIDFSSIIDTEVATVTPETRVADLITVVAQSKGPLPVVGEGGRLFGVIPRVTLLNALGGVPPSATSTLDREEAR